MEKVTIGVINFNGKNTLPGTLQSIQDLKYPHFEVILVDNHSTDGSREWVQQYFPKVRCICLDSNRGLAKASNVILQEAETDYVLLLDNDIVLEPDTLTLLMEVIQKVPRAAVCHPEIKDLTDPQAAWHYNGGYNHYLCAHIPRSYANDMRPEYEVFDMVSGGALLVDRRAALRVGGFDEDFFFNWTDGDFTMRLTLAGYLCLNVPHAVVYHKAKPRGMSKAFYQVRNRWYYIIKLYSWRTLLLASPMFLLHELFLMLFCLMKGAGKDYFRGNLAVLRDLPTLLKKRKAFQILKVKRDRYWLRSGDFFIPDMLLNGTFIKVLKKVYCGFCSSYWKVIRPLC